MRRTGYFTPVLEIMAGVQGLVQMGHDMFPTYVRKRFHIMALDYGLSEFLKMFFLTHANVLVGQILCIWFIFPF